MPIRETCQFEKLDETHMRCVQCGKTCIEAVSRFTQRCGAAESWNNVFQGDVQTNPFERQVSTLNCDHRGRIIRKEPCEVCPTGSIVVVHECQEFGECIIHERGGKSESDRSVLNRCVSCERRSVSPSIIISAVTTCPRDIDYFGDTMKSLESAGFNPLVVSDPQKQGSWPTFRRACREILNRHPADRNLAGVIFQDDVLVSAGLGQWLEAALWPEPDIDRIGVVSLYLCSANDNGKRGWFKMGEEWQPFGALAYVMTSPMMEFVVNSDSFNGSTGTDTIIGEICKRYGLSYWLHSPSLVKHTGLVSAIDPLAFSIDSENIHKFRQCKTFCENVASLPRRWT